MKYKVVLC